jgi:hypothetical protein
MRRFKSVAQAQRFLAVHDVVRNLFTAGRHRLRAWELSRLRRRQAATTACHVTNARGARRLVQRRLPIAATAIRLSASRAMPTPVEPVRPRGGFRGCPTPRPYLGCDSLDFFRAIASSVSHSRSKWRP